MTAAARRRPAGHRIVGSILRVDARRPASWLALAGAGGAAWWLSAAAARGDGPWLAAALAAGALTTAMAAGDVPRGMGVNTATWVLVRAGWPASGALAGAAVAGTVGGAGAMLAGIVAATAALVGHGRRDTPAEPLAAALLAGGAASGTALAVHVAWSAPTVAMVSAAAVAVWCAVVLGGRWLRDAIPDWDAGAAATGWASRGPLGGATATLTMATALGATVAWLFLAPHLAWCYALVAAGWFVAVAVPVAALGPGAAGERSRHRLVVSACTAPVPRGAWSRRPGPGWMAWRVAAAHAAVFGWPLVVAAALAGAAEPAAIRLGIAAALAALAVGLAAAVALVVRAGGGRETALAVALMPALIAAAAGGRHGLPKMGSLPRGNEVEQSSGFWKTPDAPQDDAGQPMPGGAVSWNRTPSRV